MKGNRPEWMADAHLYLDIAISGNHLYSDLGVLVESVYIEWEYWSTM